ncbi:tumor necrosis factor receptor superfamily member 11B-like isoform X2 [Mya arenaria]|nr:tumor necrosis factor receptor superfamily member 11B-like isoform X2 [Mya arenaria]XP_052800464.1 tumor necrosis factor receptor superfamily member 11B-like isoform X2 [Mya arenaria]
MALSTIGSFAQLNATYYSIEVNLETIQCRMCPPGTFWIRHCSQDGGQAVCKDCADGRFTEDNNRAIYCKRCSECTGTDQPSGEVVVEACTRFHDTICGCKPGYWREEGKVGNCQKVSPCEPRYGVMKMGDSHNDTTCKRCVNGKTFSNISSEVTPCQNCSICAEGWVQKSPCNETVDTACIPKGGSNNNTTVYGNTFTDISTDQNQNQKSKVVKNYRYGVIAGIACGVIVVVILSGISIVCYLRKENRQWPPCSMRKRAHHDAGRHDTEQGSPLKGGSSIELKTHTHQDNVDTLL